MNDPFGGGGTTGLGLGARGGNAAGRKKKPGGNAKTKHPFDRKQAGQQTNSFYDPGTAYGWTGSKNGKKADANYFTTDKGRFDAQSNKEDYFQWLVGQAGGLSSDGSGNPFYGGSSPFGQYMATTYLDNLSTGYNAARGQSHGRLEWLDYLKSVGWNPKNTEQYATRVLDNPNAFATMDDPWSRAQQQFLGLSARARGADSAGYSLRPMRWSVY